MVELLGQENKSRRSGNDRSASFWTVALNLLTLIVISFLPTIPTALTGLLHLTLYFSGFGLAQILKAHVLFFSFREDASCSSTLFSRCLCTLVCNSLLLLHNLSLVECQRVVCAAYVIGFFKLSNRVKTIAVQSFQRSIHGLTVFIYVNEFRMQSNKEVCVRFLFNSGAVGTRKAKRSLFDPLR